MVCKAGIQRQWINVRKAERKICDHSLAQSAVANGWHFQKQEIV